jgi:hypothetical protein
LDYGSYLFFGCRKETFNICFHIGNSFKTNYCKGSMSTSMI